MAAKKMKEAKADRAFDIINTCISVLILLITVYPIWVVLISSISDPIALMSGKVWIVPVGMNLDGYRAIFKHEQVWTGMMNSCLYTIFGTIVNMIVTILAAYPLSRIHF